MAEHKERTFLMLKPDAVHRGLIADIIKRFEQKGFKLVAMKFMQVQFTEVCFCYLATIKLSLYGFRKWYIYCCFVSVKASKELLEQHYEELKDKKFFPGLVKYMSSGPVVPMVWKFFVNSLI